MFMHNIFLKDEPVQKAPPIIGFRILKIVRASKSDVSIFDVIERLKKESWFSVNSFVYGLIFLYSVGVIEFEPPYLRSVDADR